MSKKYRAPDNTGRAQKGEQFARLFLATMQTPAWRALSPHAQRLYPWVLMEWKGRAKNNNGSIQLSIRQAAEKLGCNTGTAGRAFIDLQAKGFLVVTQCAILGAAGTGIAQGYQYEITELPLPGSPTGRKLYLHWTPGADFRAIRAKANNPRGLGGAANLETEDTDSGHRTYPVSTEATSKPAPTVHTKLGTEGAKNTINRHSNETNDLAPPRYLRRKTSLDLRE